MADQVLHMGVRGVTDLMVMPGLINLDFADIRTVMSEMGKAMMGTGEAEGEKRAIEAAEAAISNPLLDDVSMRGARGVLINITGGLDMTLYEVDAAANRIREEVDSRRQHHLRLDLRQLAAGPDAGLGGGDRASTCRPIGATAAQAPVQEPVAEAPRVVSGGFRFQPQRAQAVPFPSQNVRPPRGGRARSARPRTCGRRPSSLPTSSRTGSPRAAEQPRHGAGPRRPAPRSVAATCSRG